MGILDNDYATLMAAPDTFRLAAQRKLADAQAALDTAQQQVVADQTMITDLKVNLEDAVNSLDAVSAKLTTANSLLMADTSKILSLQSQLASAQSAVLPSLQFVEGYELNPIVMDLANRDFSKWAPRVGPNIGGEAPAQYSASSLGGVLALAVTGIPPTKNPDGTITKHWCDWLLANKRNPLPDGVTDFALDFGVVPVLMGDAGSVQCLEFDTLCIDNNFEFNLSSQYVHSSGKIQIANGTPAPGKTQGGGWIDSGIVLANFDLAAHHTIRWVYKIDRPSKSCQYVALIVDGKRFDVDPKVGVQPAYPQNWGNQLALQLQQDVNSVGGSFTTVFDSIKYIYRVSA